jgi:hypothetical protein
MATYYGTYGQKVQYLASDPSDPQTGQVWYNSTSATLKVRSVTTAGTFASGGNLGNAVYAAGGAGTQTASISFGGRQTKGGLTDTGQTELYNGTSWTTNPTGLNTAKRTMGSSGTQTAALSFGGTLGSPNQYQSATESWNGSSWTNLPGSLNTARYNFGNGAGTQTAAIYSGGYNNSNLDNVETWNGSTWTNATVYPAAKRDYILVGTQTSALGAGGYPFPTTTSASYDGTSWTTNPGLATATANFAGFGTQTAAIGAGGYAAPPGSSIATVQIYNGTSWSNNPTGLNTSRFILNSAKSSPGSVGAVFGGASATSTLSATEEWTGPGVATTKTVTVS